MNADFTFGVDAQLERGVSVVARGLLLGSGGRAANVAVMARRLGPVTRLYSCVGADELAERGTKTMIFAPGADDAFSSADGDRLARDLHDAPTRPGPGTRSREPSRPRSSRAARSSRPYVSPSRRPPARSAASERRSPMRTAARAKQWHAACACGGTSDGLHRLPHLGLGLPQGVRRGEASRERRVEVSCRSPGWSGNRPTAMTHRGVLRRRGREADDGYALLRAALAQTERAPSSCRASGVARASARSRGPPVQSAGGALAMRAYGM